MANEGVMVAAVNSGLWNIKAVCGKRYRIRCVGPANPGVPRPCTGKSVVVMVTNYCPGCDGFDLSREAFSTIANTVAGKINIAYTPYGLIMHA
ncbi:hypothetical protein F8388_026343 [Cannabis sativa]|uniref:Expansin-like EG45 domain-containing protein n=1 Tax=Cannabis sativa TaxID=3483 RepID=A0A7J6E398_CANSA|nr:hypothetical protein F8388_026343 [Cannabis sativa]